MKIAIRGGHNFGVPGAHGIVDEVTEDRKIYLKVVEYLRKLGHTVIDVTPGNTSTSADDLYWGVNVANSNNADFGCSIHLNATIGGYGTEVIYYPTSASGKAYATAIVNKIAELGFTNRGAKADVRGLYEPRATHMPWVIVECFFCDSPNDVALYNKVGVDALAKKIAEGITGQTIVEAPPVTDTTVKSVQHLLNTLQITDDNGHALDEDNIIGTNTRAAISKLLKKINY